MYKKVHAVDSTIKNTNDKISASEHENVSDKSLTNVPSHMHLTLRALQRENRRLDKKLRKLSVQYFLQTVTIFILIIISAVMVLGFWNIMIAQPVYLKEQFELSLLAIAPYVEDNVIKELSSDWVLMKSKNDFLAIKSTLDNILHEIENNSSTAICPAY